MRRGSSSFTELRKGLGLTDGTLSVHLGKLEEGGVVEIVKGFEGKRPKTVVRMTRSGKAMFRKYVEELRELLPGLDS
jgi:DNA-binding MarR family transcriptional regulator